jgi:aminobenzoyl-glutamate utilization protein B
LLFF